LLKAFFIP